jgi:hypothetical protein
MDSSIPRLERDDGKRLPFDDARTIANTGSRGTDQRVARPRGDGGCCVKRSVPSSKLKVQSFREDP